MSLCGLIYHYEGWNITKTKRMTTVFVFFCFLFACFCFVFSRKGNFIYMTIVSIFLSFIFYLESYRPVNTVKVMFNLLILFLGRLRPPLSNLPVFCAPTIVSKWQLSFLNQPKRKNDHRYYFMINITKTCLFKYIENFTTKKGKFSDKKFWYFSYFCSKHRLRVLIRTTSARQF